MDIKFKNPKIIEALAEFYFEPRETADLTVPGLFYEQIQNNFPIKKYNPPS